MGLGSWALSPHPHSQTWPQGKQQTQVRCVPFSGEPSSLTPSCPRYISVPRCAWGLRWKVLGRWLQAEAMGA